MASDREGCLYCRALGQPSTTIEHFIPERLGTGHPFWLPVGVVCDPCQKWAANSIDRSIWETDTGLAAWMFLERIPGKKKRPTRMQAPGIDFDPATGTMKFWQEQIPAAKVMKRDQALMRAYLKMGLGALAWLKGIAAAMQSRYDPAAAFVRRAGKHSGWYYARAAGRWVDPAVCLAADVALENDAATVVALQLHAVTVFVALDGNRNALRALDVPGLRIVTANVPLLRQFTHFPTLLISSGPDHPAESEVRWGYYPSHDPGNRAKLEWDFCVAPVQRIPNHSPLWKGGPISTSPPPIPAT